MKLKIFILITCCSFVLTVNGQPTTEVPTEGKPMPDLQLRGIQHYKKTTARVSDFRGKWLVLDFWARSCVTCIHNLLQVDKFQKTFGDQMQFILIGENGQSGYGKGIEEMYERMRKLQDLQLPILYDSTMMASWDEGMVPHLIVIDPKGIVRSVTTGIDMTEEKLRSMLAGNDVKFSPKDSDPLRGKRKYAITPRSYSSKLSLWNGEAISLIPVKDYVTYTNQPGFRMMQAPIEILYWAAYTGTWYWHFTDSLYSKIYPRVVLEVSSNSKFRKLMKDSAMLFNYELTVPDSLNTPEKVMSIMQKDLKTVFGVNASLEVRDMPVWKVIAQPGAKEFLRAKGDETGSLYNINGDGGAAGVSYKNWPLSVALEAMTRYMSYNGDRLIDETGIQGNVDIKIDAVLTDQSQVKSALRKNKLDLVQGKKKMLTLVIRDESL